MVDMNTRYFDQEQPIVVGLLGNAGAGKTSTADAIVPQSLIASEGVVRWDHLVLATPLYEMVTTKRMTTGEIKGKERQLYALHDLLVDLFGGSPLYGAPDYDDLVDLVRYIQGVPVPLEGKPRTFMQSVATLCREYDPDCFANRVRKTVMKQNLHYQEQDLFYAALVSDVRFINEVSMIKKQPNGVVIKLDASPEVRAARIEKRDGKAMTAEELSHESEKLDIPEEMIDLHIDTDPIGIQDVATAVKKALFDIFPGFQDLTVTEEELTNA